VLPTEAGTYKTAKILLTDNSHRGHAYSCVIDLHNSLMASHANSSSNCQLYCGKHQENSVSWHGQIMTSGYVKRYVKDCRFSIATFKLYDQITVCNNIQENVAYMRFVNDRRSIRQHPITDLHILNGNEYCLANHSNCIQCVDYVISGPKVC